MVPLAIHSRRSRIADFVRLIRRAAMRRSKVEKCWLHLAQMRNLRTPSPASLTFVTLHRRPPQRGQGTLASFLCFGAGSGSSCGNIRRIFQSPDVVAALARAAHLAAGRQPTFYHSCHGKAEGPQVGDALGDVDAGHCPKLGHLDLWDWSTET